MEWNGRLVLAIGIGIVFDTIKHLYRVSFPKIGIRRHAMPLCSSYRVGIMTGVIPLAMTLSAQASSQSTASISRTGRCARSRAVSQEYGCACDCLRLRLRGGSGYRFLDGAGADESVPSRLIEARLDADLSGGRIARIFVYTIHYTLHTHPDPIRSHQITSALFPWMRNEVESGLTASRHFIGPQGRLWMDGETWRARWPGVIPTLSLSFSKRDSFTRTAPAPATPTPHLDPERHRRRRRREAS